MYHTRLKIGIYITIPKLSVRIDDRTMDGSCSVIDQNNRNPTVQKLANGSYNVYNFRALVFKKSKE